jgi:hypothetical protein
MSDSQWGDFDVDVPLPTDLRSTTKYPWDKFPPAKNGKQASMLFLPDDDGVDTSKRLKNRIDQSLRTFIAGKQPKWQFISRVRLEKSGNKEVSGVRVWRMEDKNDSSES